MTKIIEIQSVSDIITNSSSEVFLINTTMSAEEVADWWKDVLRLLEYSEEEIENDETISGDIYGDGMHVVLSYYSMCNLREDAGSILKSKFGKRNVKASY